MFGLKTDRSYKRLKLIVLHTSTMGLPGAFSEVRVCNTFLTFADDDDMAFRASLPRRRAFSAEPVLMRKSFAPVMSPQTMRRGIRRPGRKSSTDATDKSEPLEKALAEEIVSDDRKRDHRRAPGHREDCPEVTEQEAPELTVMLRNIACSYTQAELANLLNEAGLAGTFSGMRLPRNPVRNANLGYVFVRLTSRCHVQLYMEKLAGKTLGPRQTSKKLEVSLAHVQDGLECKRNRRRRALAVANCGQNQGGRPILDSQGITGNCNGSL
jgi:hypothetical protein